MITDTLSQLCSLSDILCWRRHSIAVLALSGVGSVLLGCSGSGDTTDAVSLSPTQLFWAVQLDKHAVNLALTPSYDTVRLNPQILNAVGSPLAGDTGRVRYSYPDSSVTADSTGLLTAHYVTGSTYVIASFTTQGVTHADTVVVQVTDAVPPPIATFSLQNADGSPISCNALRSDTGDFPSVCTTLAATATDNQGNIVPLASHFSSADNNIAFISQDGSVHPVEVGRHVELYADAWAYGATLRDSFNIEIDPYKLSVMHVQDYTPLKSLFPYLRFAPPVVTIPAGGGVLFIDQAFDVPFDVTLDDSTAASSPCESVGQVDFLGDLCTQVVPGGNIPQTTYAVWNSGFNTFAEIYVRKFNKAGKYKFHSALYPQANGVIIVVDSVPQ